MVKVDDPNLLAQMLYAADNISISLFIIIGITILNIIAISAIVSATINVIKHNKNKNKEGTK